MRVGSTSFGLAAAAFFFAAGVASAGPITNFDARGPGNGARYSVKVADDGAMTVSELLRFASADLDADWAPQGLATDEASGEQPALGDIALHDTTFPGTAITLAANIESLALEGAPTRPAGGVRTAADIAARAENALRRLQQNR